MDELLPQLLAFPPHPPPAQPLSDAEYDRQIRALLQILNQTSANRLVGGVAGGGDLLDILDPSINTLPYMYALLAHINASQGGTGKQSNTSASRASLPGGGLWLRMVEFLERFDARQIRYAGTEWRRVIETTAKTARAISKPLLAIRPVKTAMLRMDPSTSTFTSTHVLFVQLCLEARSYRPALPILSNDIYHFPQPPIAGAAPFLCSPNEPSCSYINASSGISGKLSYMDHLEYHLYGAMLYIGLKDWERALVFLEYVISAPTNGVASNIMVEAYKKWVLAGLLQTGGSLPAPRTSSGSVFKTFRAIAKPYDAVAHAFVLGNLQRLREEIEVGQHIWRDDNNTGLLIQILDAHRRFAIINLEKTYSTLSIPEISIRTSPTENDHTEVEAYIVSLISSGQLNATLFHPSDPQRPTMLQFASSSTAGPQAQTEAVQYKDLQDQTMKIMRLAEHVKETDRRLALSKEYIEWMKKAKKNKGSGAIAGGGDHAMDMTWDDGPVDEDMMADF
ncbi:MAG: hypothetical protein M1827_006279 [Pycnora praestabilis]|nr:MAG: hypothetical protein M1827_006279 [Pycnora praestabilis]